LSINWEVSHSSSILRSHVCNSGSISESQVLDTRSKELNEFSNDSSLSEHLNTGENEITGWGVGGIEAESVMLGQTISMVLPEVVGFKLTG
jgi:hypothetical protein